MEKPKDGCPCLVLFDRNCPWKVWFWNAVAVPLISKRLFSALLLLAMPVCGNGAGVVVFCRRPAWKNHTRSRTIGPPSVHS